eukprot:gene1682-2878_t
MVQQKKGGWKDLVNGAVLQMVEAATLGMPFEVWKTHMGRNRNEGTFEAFGNVYRNAGGGATPHHHSCPGNPMHRLLAAYGTAALVCPHTAWPTAPPGGASSQCPPVPCPPPVTSPAQPSTVACIIPATGAILLYSKEALLDATLSTNMNAGVAGALAGAGGGICQVVVMGPCTFLVTAVVTGKGTVSEHLSNTWQSKGSKYGHRARGFFGFTVLMKQLANLFHLVVAGFYPGGSAIAMRQATNWASRQGFTEAARSRVRSFYQMPPSEKLSIKQEAASGMIGGLLSCWNHPFEVCRIEMQARAVAGESKLSMLGVMKQVNGEYGPAGLFKGIIPRACLGIWQTLFMVTGAKLVRERLL